MKLKISKPFWQAVGLGVLAGMRTTSAPAITSHILSRHHSKRLAKSNLRFMQNSNVAAAFKVLAVGELIGDKMPTAPDRTMPGGLIFRCIAGSLAGASIFEASGKNAFAGALIGSVAALGSTFGSFHLRKGIVTHTKALDP